MNKSLHLVLTIVANLNPYGTWYWPKWIVLIIAHIEQFVDTFQTMLIDKVKEKSISMMID